MLGPLAALQPLCSLAFCTLLPFCAAFILFAFEFAFSFHVHFICCLHLLPVAASFQPHFINIAAPLAAHCCCHFTASFSPYLQLNCCHICCQIATSFAVNFQPHCCHFMAVSFLHFCRFDCHVSSNNSNMPCLSGHPSAKSSSLMLPSVNVRGVGNGKGKYEHRRRLSGVFKDFCIQMLPFCFSGIFPWRNCWIAVSIQTKTGHYIVVYGENQELCFYYLQSILHGLYFATSTRQVAIGNYQHSQMMMMRMNNKYF
ncbi:hypothetical protein SLEP1_g9830 [Rubroshorea leprosula]|uniref:Uncharacterized protein n=1 Tax=Rubroshorea leprosula TaxID=152421 RepID=A0AAV5IG14_9ROSI|nr:hypothetical protein SLEP1_g9830 [Rubroshorea leprosula]